MVVGFTPNYSPVLQHLRAELTAVVENQALNQEWRAEVNNADQSAPAGWLPCVCLGAGRVVQSRATNPTAQHLSHLTEGISTVGRRKCQTRIFLPFSPSLMSSFLWRCQVPVISVVTWSSPGSLQAFLAKARHGGNNFSLRPGKKWLKISSRDVCLFPPLKIHPRWRGGKANTLGFFHRTACDWESSQDERAS